MKTKPEIMSESEAKDAVKALFRWFEGQDINPLDAFQALVRATGTMLGMLAVDERQLKSGLIAVQKDIKEIAKNVYIEDKLKP